MVLATLAPAELQEVSVSRSPVGRGHLVGPEKVQPSGIEVLDLALMVDAEDELIGARHERGLAPGLEGVPDLVVAVTAPEELGPITGLRIGVVVHDALA